MNDQDFQSFVSEHDQWFRGVNPETEAQFESAELNFKQSLPKSMKWLLTTRGYSGACGIGSLAEAVSATLRCRTAFGLPDRFVVLNDWGDGGVVYLDAPTGVITWGDGSDLYQLAAGAVPQDGNEVFSDYPAWTKARLELEKTEA